MNERYRTCSDCGKSKPVSQFWAPRKTRKASKTYFSEYRYCAACGGIRQRARYSPERERKYRANRYAADPDYKTRQHLRHNYDISLEQYDALAVEQGGRCAICASGTAKNRNGAERFHIDHDHATGEIRGLLCGNCNAGIGRFKDNPDFLLAAGAYLLREGHTGLYVKRTYGYGRKGVKIVHRD